MKISFSKAAAPFAIALAMAGSTAPAAEKILRDKGVEPFVE